MSAYGTKRTNLMGRGTSATEKVCGVAKPNPLLWPKQRTRPKKLAVDDQQK